MQYLRVKNHDLYQHYGTRNPPWVKLYRVIMGDYDLRQVPVSSRLCFIYCTILASETDNRIPFDCNFLSDRMGFKVTEEIVSGLIERGLLLASGARRLLATEEKRSSLLSSSGSSLNSPVLIPDLRSNPHAEDFEQFWVAYPKKVGKKDALKSWMKASDKPQVSEILMAIENAKKSEQWLKDNGQFIPNPATWLKQGRWDDQPSELKGRSNGKAIPPFPGPDDPIGRGLWRRSYGDPDSPRVSS